MQLGAFMANRDFNCLLCNTSYTRMTGDLIVPTVETCDQCLQELGELPADNRVAEIARRLKANAENLGDRYQGDDWVHNTASYLATEISVYLGGTKNTEKS